MAESASTAPEGPSVSVIVPTVGRPELGRALASVRNQTSGHLEIIVVDDSHDASVQAEAGVVVLRTGGGRGAAAARNLGVEHSKGELIAFLDDDDEWLPDHLADAVSTLERHPDVDLYAARALVHSGTAGRVEPTVVFRGRGTLLRFYYGRTTWARRRRRVMTPTLVFRRQVGRLQMDPGMVNREDLWWLLSAERAGHRLLQTEHVGVVVHLDVDREAGRRDLDSEIAWADRLETLARGAWAWYLVGTTCRLLARQGQHGTLDELAVRIRSRTRLPPDLAVVLALLQVYARLRPAAGAPWPSRSTS